MYRSGTTAIARFLAGEHKIAFCSDPIRPFLIGTELSYKKILIALMLKIIQDLWEIIFKVILTI